MQSEFIPGRAPAAIATIATDHLRMTVERVTCGGTGGHLQVRLSPGDVPTGALIGPRVALDLRPEHARDLAALLIAQADGIDAVMGGRDAPASTKGGPNFIAAVDDLQRALAQAEAMAGHGYGGSGEAFHALSESERDAYMWGLADRIREAHAALRRMIPAPAAAVQQ